MPFWCKRWLDVSLMLMDLSRRVGGFVQDCGGAFFMDVIKAIRAQNSLS